MSDLTSFPPSPSKSNHSRKESRRRRIQDRGGPCLSPSRHWEVELWRRSQSITSKNSETSISNPLDYCQNVTPPSRTLPSNPIAFDLNPPLSSSGPYDRRPALTPRYTEHRRDSTRASDLDQLRLDALTELQKSVVETGEGFVDKMRDWESHRQQEAAVYGGLKRSRSMIARATPDPMDDTDDVMILDSAPADEEVHFEESRKKRALSVDIMDGLDVTSSGATPSATTDDETESCSRHSIGAVPSSYTPLYHTIPPSYSDKAVSALTLAFANGACGINDYQAVLDAYNHTHYGEESHVGELWD